MSDQPDLPAEPPAPPPSAPEPKLHVTTPVVRELLRKRYAAPEWALMEEVATATGGGTRYADAIAVNLWSSRGHAVHGFEIKISRSDWLRELKAPEKAEPVFRYCDHWFIVAPRGIVHEHELPPTWGLLEVRASGLVAVKAAPKLEAQPLTRAFFASMMRRGFELLDSRAAAMAQASIREARAEVERQVSEEVRRRTSEHAALQRQVDEFKAATGLDFSRYSGPPTDTIKLAQRLHALQDYHRSDGGFSRLASLAGELERAAETVRKALDECGMTPRKEPT